MEIKLFSLVVPAYKQEKTIGQNLSQLDSILKSLPYDYEILVVVDGFLDKTLEKAKEIANKNKKIKVFGYGKNFGKGYAVKYGMSKAKGDVVGFIDGGMDLDPSAISILIDLMKFKDADIVVGSKQHPDSIVNYPLYRKILTFFTRWWTQFLFGFTVLDTQVGLKIFKRKVAMDVFPRLLVKKFAFDIEMLAVANVLGYHKIYEAPIKLNFKEGSISKKSLIVTILHCFWDTLAIFYRIRILQYYRLSNKENWIKQ